MNVSKKDWDALNAAVAIAETVLLLRKLELAPEVVANVAAAREALTHAEVKRPKAYLPSRHPYAN